MVVFSTCYLVSCSREHRNTWKVSADIQEHWRALPCHLDPCAQEHLSHSLSRSPTCWTLVQHCCALARGGETNPWCTGHGPSPQQTSKPQEIATFRPGNTPYLGWGSESLALVQSPSKHTKVLPAQGGYRVWDVRPDPTHPASVRLQTGAEGSCGLRAGQGEGARKARSRTHLTGREAELHKRLHLKIDPGS